MTRGGLSIDQKMVDRFVDTTVQAPTDFAKAIDLSDLGFDIQLDFGRIKELFARGLCLDLQRRERGSSSIKMADIAGALKADDPLEFLRAKGYDSKVLGRLAK